MNNIIIILALTICVLFVNIIILYIKLNQLESHAKALGAILKMYINKDNNKVKPDIRKDMSDAGFSPTTKIEFYLADIASSLNQT